MFREIPEYSRFVATVQKFVNETQKEKPVKGKERKGSQENFEVGRKTLFLNVLSVLERTIPRQILPAVWLEH